MRNLHLKLGDLVDLEGLEKPREDIVKFELGGKAEKLKRLKEKVSDLAGNIEDHKDVQAGDVAGLVAGLKDALVRELSPEKAAEILKTLKTRFLKKKKPYKTEHGMKWEDIQSKLETNPEKLWSLNEMEKTGGEPDVLGQDEKTGEYIFMDCSLESPKGRRNCVYDREAEEWLKKNRPTETWKGNAVSMAALMGVEILNEKEYRELQTKGGFDENSWSWLKTPVDKRKTDVALFGRGDRGEVHVDGHNPRDRYDVRAWRGSLSVK